MVEYHRYCRAQASLRRILPSAAFGTTSPAATFATSVSARATTHNATSKLV